MRFAAAEIKRIHPYGSTNNIWMEAVTAVDGGFHYESLAEYLKIDFNVTRPYKLLKPFDINSVM